MSIGPTETRTLTGVTLDDAAQTLQRYGYDLHDQTPDRLVLAKPGSRFSPRGHQRPLQAELVPDGDDLELHLRYDQAVLADTGDLAGVADRLERALAGSPPAASDD